MTDHPAKFSKGMTPFFLNIVARHYISLGEPERSIKLLDPFAGTGRIHEMACSWIDTTGCEIEFEWASMNPRTFWMDALEIEQTFSRQWFDVICTSPTYGNRMADHHDAKDGSKRRTYRHTLGRPLAPNNSGQLQWGTEYKTFHKEVWRQCHAVQRKGGLFILNISNHIRKGEEIEVAGWHTEVLNDLGYELREPWFFPTKGMKFGANSDKRTPGELVLVYRKEQ